MLLSVAYNFYFDVRYDWGLLELRAKQNLFLRNRLIFPKWVPGFINNLSVQVVKESNSLRFLQHQWYYVAIPLNLIGRCSWALTVSASFFPTTNVVFSTVIATVRTLVLRISSLRTDTNTSNQPNSWKWCGEAWPTYSGLRMSSCPILKCAEPCGTSRYSLSSSSMIHEGII